MAQNGPGGTASSNKQQAILYGKQLPTLLTFAVPIICGNLFQQLYNIVDAIVVGRYLGKLPLSGISAASPIMDLVYGLIVGACTGVGVLISQLCGAGEWEKLKKVHATALTGGIAFALILTAAVILSARPILVSEGTAADTVSQAMTYLAVVAGGLIFNFLYVYYAAVLRSYGNSRFPFIVLAASSILHALLDVVLIRGLQFGVAGVAASTVSCQILTALALIWYTHKNCPPLSLAKSDIRFHKGMGGIILSYAWATAMQTTVVYTGRLLIQGMLTPLGQDTVTGYNMGMRLENLLQAVSQGISASTVVCMAQNLGHRNADRLRGFFRKGLIADLIYGLIIGCVCILLPRQLIGIFSTDKAVIEAGAAYTGTMAFLYMFSMSGEMLQGFFRGIGKLKVTMIASAGQVILRVILSAILIPKLGIYGICISVVTGWFLLTVFEGIYAHHCSKRITFPTSE
ncbi:MAG: MATE family efflux transporter [Lachnospiraceae bacterium]|nr:MATE family efflux transporter [Lachnospiraceae bacterium]